MKMKSCKRISSGGWFSIMGRLIVSGMVVLLVYGSAVEGKRGCANFGHSCYGGMGKRADNVLSEGIASNMMGEQLNEMQQVQEENPAFVFTGPRSIPRTNIPNGKIDINQLPPYLRFWMRSLRNMKNAPDYV